MTEKRLASALAVMVFAGAACATHQPTPGEGLGPADVDTPIVLFPQDSTCGLSAKQQTVTAHPDKWLKFEIVSYCGSKQVVVVGNFRTVETPSPAPANCDNAMHGDAPPIFQQDDLRRRTAELDAGSPGDPEDEDIKLKLKKDADLPGKGTLTYYFDVCLNGTKADPRLLVER